MSALEGFDAAYTMRLCGDCAAGPPCRCSQDPAVVVREWISGHWVSVAHCFLSENEAYRT
jgi:hypothetical protein